MKTRTSQLILIAVTATILATVGLQLRWNLKNYRENRRQLLSEIQIAFDTGVENYYADNAKRQIVLFANDSLPGPARSILSDTLHSTISYSETLGGKEKLRIIRRLPQLPDSARRSSMSVNIIRSNGNFRRMKEFTNRILFSMLRDSVSLEALDRAVYREFMRKNLDVRYGLHYQKADGKQQRFFKRPGELTQTMSSKSTYLPPTNKLTLHFSDPALMALKRSSAEIALSLLLSLSIIGCLLYLLRTINRQKKIEEIRNDLIGNITHEFKTPITTIGSAIEGIRSFNAENDPEKTERYLDISQNQLHKLGTMVEKLLETATLEAGAITLDRKPADVPGMLHNLAEKFRLATSKSIVFETNRAALEMDLDAFHFENALSNLVDNAVKYGGNHIVLQLTAAPDRTEISVCDDGIGIGKAERERIFDKFYRIPSGNVHDVKGFGIGLYYARKIVESHGGSLSLQISPGKTRFKIMFHG